MREAEYRALRKYLKGKDLDDEDRLILDEWATMGYVQYGYSLDRDSETARITDAGRRWLQREKIARNPLTRFLYTWYANLA